MSVEQASIMMSIRPSWCYKIVSGEKTIEVRKTRPKLGTPFKCYIYCTKANKACRTICGCWVLNDDELYRHPKKGVCYGDSIELMVEDDYTADNFLNGKVIGEFICDEIKQYWPETLDFDELSRESLVPLSDLYAYIGQRSLLHGWHIKDFKLYDTPHPLSDYTVDGVTRIERAPQSWCYVRRKEDNNEDHD